MTTPPSLPDLEHAGITFDYFLNRLTQYVGIRRSAIWVVRWNGRLRPIRGQSIFSSREGARAEVILWLRNAGRYAFLSGETSQGRLNKNWGYKKAYRTFIEDLVTFLEQTGGIEYVQLQAEAETQHESRPLVG